MTAVFLDDSSHPRLRYAAAATLSQRSLGLVDFAIFPHLNYPGWDENTMAEAEKWAASLDCPAYALDNASAISAVDGTPTVVSEGEWRQFQ